MNYDTKVTIEQLNIWWSPTSVRWITCALVVAGHEGKERLLKKERVEHSSYGQAIQFAQDRYVGVYV